MKKYALVTEGGGKRGAYTAGCLKWLIDHNIEFDSCNAISATAVFNSYFLAKDTKALETISTKLLNDKQNIGIIPVFREFQLMGYNFMFNHLLKREAPLDFEKVKQAKGKLQFGVYSKEEAKLVWVDNEMLAKHPGYLQASCVLPVAGRSVKIDKKHYLDGGIETMMPIFHAQATGNELFFCITTKHESYIREPNGKLLSFIINLLYFRYPKMIASINKRVEIYYQEMGRIEELIKDKKALLMRPSKLLNVSRLSASTKDLEELFEMGYQDCENRKEEIIMFLGLN